MANRFLPRRTTTAGKAPALTDLLDGEIGINFTDAKIYQRIGSTIKLIGLSATTLAGYGITDAATATQGAKADAAWSPSNPIKDALVQGLFMVGVNGANPTTKFRVIGDGTATSRIFLDAINNDASAMAPMTIRASALTLDAPLTLTGQVKSYAQGYTVPAGIGPLVTKEGNLFTAGAYNGHGRFGIFIGGTDQLGFGLPAGIAGPYVFRFNADSSIANTYTLYHTGNLDTSIYQQKWETAANYVTIAQNATVYTDANELGGKLAHGLSGATAINHPGAFYTTWNLGTNGNRDGQLSWFYGNNTALYFRNRYDQDGAWRPWAEIWTTAKYDPSTFVRKTDPGYDLTNYLNKTVASTITANLTVGAQLVVNNNSFRVQGWGGDLAQGVTYYGNNDSYIYKTAGGFNFKVAELGITALLNSGGTVWTTGNYTPINNRPRLGTAAQQISDWNAAVDNGWYMAPGAANAPVGNWLIGTVTQHNGDWIQQIVHDFTQGGDVAEWRRWKKGGTWSGWTQNYRVGGTLFANMINLGYDPNTNNSIGCSNWFRSLGETGIYFASYGGGWYMIDGTYIRAYNGKQVAAADFVIWSDERKKTAIRALDFKGPLRPVHYAYKEDGRVDFGFIAQEVMALYPEAVTMGKDEFYHLSYGKLTAVLAAQNNLQQEQIDAQAKRIAQLEELLERTNGAVERLLERLSA